MAHWSPLVDHLSKSWLPVLVLAAYQFDTFLSQDLRSVVSFAGDENQTQPWSSIKQEHGGSKSCGDQHKVQIPWIYDLQRFELDLYHPVGQLAADASGLFLWSRRR